MTRRVIFLDVDGVLNSLDWTERRGPFDAWRVPNEQRRAASFDPDAVARLNRLIARSGAGLVLSSQWRKLGLDAMRHTFATIGLCGQLVDRTPLPAEHDLALFRRLLDSERPTPRVWPRGYEIQQWLDAHADVTGIVILDDSVSMEHLAPWQIQTSMRTGLVDAHLEQALGILRGPRPPPSVRRSPGAQARPQAVPLPSPSPNACSPTARPRPRVERVVFLDIDGVLNNARSRKRDEGRWRDLDPEAVGRLDRILERAKAAVVLSSAWRKAIDVHEVQSRLADNGFRGTVLDRLPTHEEHDPAVLERLGETKIPRGRGAWPRGYEIQQWLDAHPEVTGIAILDEGHDMKHLQPWLVDTNHISGLRDDHVDRTLAILLGPPPARPGDGSP